MSSATQLAPPRPTPELTGVDRPLGQQILEQNLMLDAGRVPSVPEWEGMRGIVAQADEVLGHGGSLDADGVPDGVSVGEELDGLRRVADPRAWIMDRFRGQLFSEAAIALTPRDTSRDDERIWRGFKGPQIVDMARGAWSEMFGAHAEMDADNLRNASALGVHAREMLEHEGIDVDAILAERHAGRTVVGSAAARVAFSRPHTVRHPGDDDPTGEIPIVEAHRARASVLLPVVSQDGTGTITRVRAPYMAEAPKEDYPEKGDSALVWLVRNGAKPDDVAILLYPKQALGLRKTRLASSRLKRMYTELDADQMERVTRLSHQLAAVRRHMRLASKGKDIPTRREMLAELGLERGALGNKRETVDWIMQTLGNVKAGYVKPDRTAGLKRGLATVGRGFARLKPRMPVRRPREVQNPGRPEQLYAARGGRRFGLVGKRSPRLVKGE